MASFPRKALAAAKPPDRLHELQRRRLAERRADLRHIGIKHRRQIGIGDGRVAAPDQLDQGPDLVADRNLFEPDLAPDLGEPPFVLGEAPAMDQHDGQSAIAGMARGGQVGARFRFVQRPVHGPIGPEPLVDLDHPVVQGLRKDDVAGEDVRAGLPADLQCVPEPARDGQHRGLALALQQGIGGDGCAHADVVDEPRGDRTGAGVQDAAHALDRRVVVLLGIVRQQFGGGQGPPGRAGDDVGEGAAPVDPEAPALGRCRRRSHSRSIADRDHGGKCRVPRLTAPKDPMPKPVRSVLP